MIIPSKGRGFINQGSVLVASSPEMFTYRREYLSDLASSSICTVQALELQDFTSTSKAWYPRCPEFFLVELYLLFTAYTSQKTQTVLHSTRKNQGSVYAEKWEPYHKHL